MVDKNGKHAPIKALNEQEHGAKLPVSNSPDHSDFTKFLDETETLFHGLVAFNEGDPQLHRLLVRLGSNFCFVNEVVRSCLARPSLPLMKTTAESEVAGIAKVLCGWAQLPEVPAEVKRTAETVSQTPSYSSGTQYFEFSGVKESLESRVSSYVGMSSMFVAAQAK